MNRGFRFTARLDQVLPAPPTAVRCVVQYNGDGTITSWWEQEIITEVIRDVPPQAGRMVKMEIKEIAGTRQTVPIANLMSFDV